MIHKSYLAGVALAALTVGVPSATFTLPALAQVSVGVTVTIDTLRERVGTQGDFVKVATIGEVWRPRDVPKDWKPYTRGNWIYNDKVGWYFNSDEPFAEVTYHYGRWYEDQEQGWVWVADTKWAPAWVEWRRNKQYVGWRPLPPENAPRRTRRTTTTVTATRASPDFYEEEWIFVPSNKIIGSRIDTVMIRREQVVEIYSQTEVVGSVEQRGGIYVNLSLQPTVLQRDSNVTIQSTNLPQARTVPVPAQVQQISTETKATIAPAAASPPPISSTSQGPSGASTPATTTPPASATAAPNTPGAASAPSSPTPAVKSTTSATTPTVPSSASPPGAATPTQPAAKSSTSASTPPAAAAQPPAGSAPAPAVKSPTAPSDAASSGKPPTSAPATSPPSSKSSEKAPPPKPANPTASSTPEAPKAGMAPSTQPAASKPPAATAPLTTTDSQRRPEETKKLDKGEPAKKSPAGNEAEGKNREKSMDR